jgi:hypothetical protein
MASVRLHVVGAGNSPLVLSNTVITDTDGSTIPVVEGAALTVDVAAPPPGTTFPTTCASGATAVCVQPAAQTAPPGSDVTFGVIASRVTSLGSFQFTLAVNPSVLAPFAVTGGPFLGSTGRAVTCAAPVINAGSVQYSCDASGPEPPTGATGSGILATIQMHVIGSNSSTSALQLSNVKLTDTAGAQLPVLFNGAVTSELVTPTPCPGGICPTPTDTATPTATATPNPISCPTALGVASMCLRPSAITVNAGDTFSVEVIVTNASDIGSFEFELSFDGVRMTPISAVDAGFLGSSGRTVQCPPEIIDPSGSKIRFGCATIGASPPGPDAPGVLAVVTFTANISGSFPLQFTKSTLSDPLADPILVSATDGSVTIQ